jgi:hypothetical protein
MSLSRTELWNKNKPNRNRRPQQIEALAALPESNRPITVMIGGQQRLHRLDHVCSRGRLPQLRQRAMRNSAPFPCSASGSSRIRLRADLASHSRAFCRSSAALWSASFSLIRIWCVSMVLTLTFNSLANSETLTPLPINEKISSPRSLTRDYRTLSPKDREILA